MNKKQRKELQVILDTIYEEAEAVRDMAWGEFDKLLGMPEGLQESKKGQAIEQAAGALEEAADRIEGQIDTLRKL